MGLDVSTRCVGISLLSVEEGKEPEMIVVTHLRPKIPTKVKGTEALFMKSRIIGAEIKKYSVLGVTDVVIEEPLVGSNNANTVATLLRFNGMISQSVYDSLGVVPTFISSYEARKYACPQLMEIRKFTKSGELVPRQKVLKAINKGDLVLFGGYSFDCAKKFILWNIMTERYPDIQWQYKPNGELKDENFDASDSLICALGFIAREKYGEDEPSIVEWTEKGDSVEYVTEFCGKRHTHRLEFYEEKETGES